MDNQKYFNYYVETLTNTLTDAIIRNVSLQASVKIAEESVQEYEKTFELLDAEIGQLKEQLFEERNKKDESVHNTISSLESEIKRLNAEMEDLRNQKSDFENTRQKLQHLDTFKQQIVVCREESEKMKKDYESIIDDLNKKIEYLQLSPAKRKKIDELNKSNVDELTKDGGIF